MQNSPHDIKEKLLQSLDHEYNVVDMAAVLEVIAALEKAYITKEALEKTRIGRYINELRKRTKNEQLARRAKDLVKSWRKLLPQRINGDTNNVSSPALGPGPGPGNRKHQSLSVPGTPQYKASSPLFLGEQSSSPLFSSASSSPLLNSVYQGSSLPSHYAPLKFSQSHAVAPIGKFSCVTKSPHLSNQSKNIAFNQNFDASFVVLRQAINSVNSFSDSTCNRTSCSPNVSPDLRTNSSSSSTSVSINLCFQNLSPNPAYSTAHSTLNTSKTNCTSKIFQKDMANKVCAVPQNQVLNDSLSRVGNGTPELTQSFLPSEISSFKHVLYSKCSEKDGLDVRVKSQKRKRSFEMNELQENKLGEMIASLPSGSKLPKVKTTQQLIADLHAKQKVGSVSPDVASPSIVSLQNAEADISQTKSELLKKFLIAQCARQGCINETSTDESSVPINRNFSLQSVADISSVIKKDLDVSTCIYHRDSVEDDIYRILSTLPPINASDINLEEDNLPIRCTSVSNNDLNRLSEIWEYVNGVYDCNGSWRAWNQCCEQKSLGESILLLPYVNID